MYSKKKLPNYYVALLALVCVGTSAAEIEVELELGVGQTDNTTRAAGTVAEPTMDDTVYEAGLAVTVEHESARSDVDLRAMLRYHGYQDGPYDSETLPALDLGALFRVTERSLSWFIDGTVGQQTIDPFQPVTPDNRESIAFLTTGPSLFIPMGTRFSLRTDLSYSMVDYEEQPLDSTRKGAQLSLVRQMNPTRSISLNVRGERTDFDFDALFAPIDRYDAFMQFATEGARNEVTVDMGWSVVERLVTKSEEPLVNVSWQRRLSQTTDLDITLGSRVSDSAESFRGNQQDSIDLGDVQNQQGTTDPFREDYLGLSIIYGTSRTNVTLGSRWVEENYLTDVTLQDRQLLQLYANLSRELGRSWRVGLYASHDSHDYESTARKDEDINSGLRLTWQQLRTIEIDLRFDRVARKSTVDADEFTENRVYLGFRYVPEIGR